MDLVLLHHRSTTITGRRLAKELGLQACTKPHQTVGKTVVIRWGSSIACQSDRAINSRESIELASNGIKALRRLAERKVPTLEMFVTTPPGDPKMYPILGRRINHRAGKDIVWCDTIVDAQTANRPYFTRYIDIDTELRVHVFNGEILKVFRKVMRDPEADPIIRTSVRGWGYRRVNPKENYPKAQRVSIDALAALGLTFGAVDLGWSREARQYYVFEVNTGPALNPHTFLLYLNRFKEYLNHEVEGLYRSREAN